MSLEYSPEGLNCLPLFDKSAKTISIEVEGEEDIPFWDEIISSCINTNGYKVVCSPQGGCKKIIKHLIEKEKLKILLQSLIVNMMKLFMIKMF